MSTMSVIEVSLSNSLGGLDDDVMIGKILSILTALKDTDEAIKVEAQRVQNKVLDNMRGQGI